LGTFQSSPHAPPEAIRGIFTASLHCLSDSAVGIPHSKNAFAACPPLKCPGKNLCAGIDIHAINIDAFCKVKKKP
ncbi:MAG: hypothetical protein ABIB65_05570, partial [Candidatus Margulisiibacteriota bacterium]